MSSPAPILRNMFTGLVEATARITSLAPHGDQQKGVRMGLECPNFAPDRRSWEPQMGESIAISGCCLTLCALEGGGPVFELSQETLERTWLSQARVGQRVNFERSLTLEERLGGHLVSGHVDGVAHLIEKRDPGDGGAVYTFEVPEGLERYLVDKGSVTLDGVSLTVVAPTGRRFDVALIPETLARTSLGTLEPSQPVHMEADLIGKWIERLVVPYR